MTTIHLLSQSEKRAKFNPHNLDPWPLYHQMRTFESLSEYDLVMNTYNTGTGKTVASLLHLFRLNGKNKNVLFIAPTNALLAQHATDIQNFVIKNKLDFAVKRVTAAEIRSMEREQRPNQNRLRPGETLQRLIHNYLEFEPDQVVRKPLILVVNPDIFYYAIYFRYGAHDQRNVFERFLTAFDYIVIDEFHYYDYKQLANFLFAFALFDQLGYFTVRGRKICLLSATPAEAVAEYLTQLFGDRWVRIGPDNEPPESEDLETLPALTSMTLKIVGGILNEWIGGNGREVVGWALQDGLDGAIISSSLAQVNSTYVTLRPLIAEAHIGRITGPEPEEIRAESTARKVILATPTVDIGYNFVKHGKARQNVDFLICDARFSDELLQRIGRAGRVLGKEVTVTPSRGLALLPPDAAAALSQYDGQTFSRGEFARMVHDCSELPPKHTLTGYVRSHAITECFWPIYSFNKMLPQNLEHEVEALYDRVRTLFAPNSRRTMGGLKGFFHKYEKRERWLLSLKQEPMAFDKATAEHVADWLEWLDPTYGKINAADLQPHLRNLLTDDAQQKGLLSFINSQVAITSALFSFRDSFQGPKAVIYDPTHIFSSQTVNEYDLLHLIRNYHLSPPMTLSQFQRSCTQTDLIGDFYFQLRGQRESGLVLEFVYASEEGAKEFEEKWCRSPVGLNGLRLQVRERGGDLIAGGLDQSIITAIEERTLSMLIVPPDNLGPMHAKLRGTNLWAQRMTIRFPDGSQDERYRVLIGTAAFHAHAELLSHFLMRNRLREEAIIL